MIVDCFKSNYSLAEQCWRHVQDENIEGVGECLCQYWNIKKTLAPGAEPLLVKNILQTLDPFIIGGSLAGAGGGGFMTAVLKDGVDKDMVVERVRRMEGTERLTFHTVSVDREGLSVSVGEENVIIK